jgi:hypothetical protein
MWSWSPYGLVEPKWGSRRAIPIPQRTSQYLSACLSRMGFDKTRIISRGNRHSFRYDQELVRKLMAKYEIDVNDEEGMSDPEEEGLNFLEDKSIAPIDLGIPKANGY